MSVTIHTGGCLDILPTLPAESVHCVVTSPPYWGLRDYGVEGQLGLDRDYQEYIAKLVEVFREVRRVLRDDGTVWLNLGDSYATGAGKVGDCPGGGVQGARWMGRDHSKGRGTPIKAGGKRRKDGKYLGPVTQPNRMPQTGVKAKDLMMMPARVALALQADGWWLRSEIVWAKPNPMPESVTDRPTSAHEKMFLLAKSQRYFFDAEAVRESDSGKGSGNGYRRIERLSYDGRGQEEPWEPGGGRNIRNVWTIATAPYSEAHFATFPPALIEPCIKAGTSERGCCVACGAPWVREVTAPSGGTTGKSWHPHENDLQTGNAGGGFGQKMWNDYKGRKTTGWSPSCECDVQARSCTVLDPFAGAGTTGLVADRLGRDAVLIELNPEYAEMARRRIEDDAGMFADMAI